jgi:dihydroorotate dehydrogenase (NAD+) catalytic subunit
MSPDLSVEIAGIRLKNPVMAASGTFGYGVEFAPLLDLNSLGGLVVKGLSREPMPGNPAPRLHETASGMLNAVGLQNIGAAAFVREKLPGLRGCQAAVFANVFGYATEDYVEVIRILEEGEGLAGYELNVSCPNTRRGGISFAADAGADALSLVNTLVGMAIDLEARRPVLPNVTGGLSGPAIKPVAATRWSSWWPGPPPSRWAPPPTPTSAPRSALSTRWPTIAPATRSQRSAP